VKGVHRSMKGAHRSMKGAHRSMMDAHRLAVVSRCIIEWLIFDKSLSPKYPLYTKLAFHLHSNDVAMM
jgi:hypothetical protein